MVAPLECPGIDCWQALLDDTLAPGRQEEIERHLESCPACQERLHRAGDRDDALRGLGRRVGDPTSAPDDPALAAVLRRLREVKSPVRPGPLEPAELYFLRPTDRPALLGTLGGYEVQEVIGQGGMGVVLKAFDPPLHRLVAIKVLSPALAGSATARRRFTREARAAAAVCHEHVVAVHGVHETDGLPYLVMQYVAGESLQDRLDRTGPLELAEVVRIGLQTAAGLAAAHAQGLIHRDIKPANLLLENGVARVKITDFGLARSADDARLTQAGVVSGTPEYMAPEQARGEAVDHRADLFSLGGVLYAMCTGRPPFRGSTALAVLRRVNDEAAAPVRSLNPAVPAWLEGLIARLMAKDAAQRPQSAAEVAALLEGYLAHLRQPATVPAPALPPPPAGKRPRRPRGLWLPALVFLAVLGGATLLALAGAAAFQAGQAPPGPADADIDPGIRALAFSPDGQRLVTGGSDHDQPGQFQIWDVAAGKALVTRRAEPGLPAVAYSPDGTVFATGHWGGAIELRDPATGDVRATLTGHDVGANALAFSDDGALLASAGLDKTVRIWDVKARQQRQLLLGHEEMVFAVAFFHSGRAVVSAGQDRTIRIWNLDTGQEQFVLRGHETPIDKLAVSPDDKVVVSGDWTGNILFWDPQTGQKTAALRQKTGVNALAFSPDGKLLASGSWDGVIRVWDLPSRKLHWSARKHTKSVRALAFSPDGRLLASGSEDGTARLRDVAADKDVAILSAVGAPAAPDVPAGTSPRVLPPWLAVAALLGLLLTLALSVGLYVHQHRRGRKKAPPPAAAAEKPAEAAPPPAPVPLVCPGCGKRLKVKAELGGKKVKCPQCGRALPVPSIQAAEAGTIPGSRPVG
jgi:sugar lactone lactonase YvrE